MSFKFRFIRNTHCEVREPTPAETIALRWPLRHYLERKGFTIDDFRKWDDDELLSVAMANAEELRLGLPDRAVWIRRVDE